MEDKKIEAIFNKIGENIDYITENERRILILIEKIEGDNEELRKQLFFLARATKKLKEEIDSK